MSDLEHSAMPADRQRRAQRKNVFILVQLFGDFGDTTAKLRDLSNLGARLDCPIALNVGETLTLIRGGISLPARVRWMRGKSVGLEFLEATPPEALIAAASGAAPATVEAVPEAFRPEPMRALSRAEERRLAQIWAPG